MTATNNQRTEIDNLPATTDQAREYLVDWHKAQWPHAPFFSDYIRKDLAGDFAFHLARHIARSAPPAGAGGDERAMFEAWARKECEMPEDAKVNWHADWTKAAWEGWQAARAAHPIGHAGATVAKEPNEVAVSAAMSEGNKHGVNSIVAARIVAAYLNAAPASPSGATVEGEYQRNVLESCANWLDSRSNTVWANETGYSGLMRGYAADLRAIRAVPASPATGASIDTQEFRVLLTDVCAAYNSGLQVAKRERALVAHIDAHVRAQLAEAHREWVADNQTCLKSAAAELAAVEKERDNLRAQLEQCVAESAKWAAAAGAADAQLAALQRQGSGEPVYQYREAGQNGPWEDCGKQWFDKMSASENVSLYEFRTLYAAPVSAQAGPVTLMTDKQAEDWAWEQVERDCGLDKGPIGDKFTFYGFFLHGWRYRAQYERQRPHQAAAPHDPAARVPDGWTMNPMCERKTNDIMQREGYQKTGYVLMKDDPTERVCVSDQGAVSWFTRDQWNWLMHNRDHVEFQWPKPLAAAPTPAAQAMAQDGGQGDRSAAADAGVLPTWEQSAILIECDAATPLHVFINEQEPDAPWDERFREQLKAALDYVVRAAAADVAARSTHPASGSDAQGDAGDGRVA